MNDKLKEKMIKKPIDINCCAGVEGDVNCHICDKLSTIKFVTVSNKTYSICWDCLDEIEKIKNRKNKIKNII